MGEQKVSFEGQVRKYPTQTYVQIPFWVREELQLENKEKITVEITKKSW